jgi:hypothetical protein
MKDKGIIYRFFHPGKLALLIICSSAALFLTAVFRLGLKKTMWAQPAYWYSLYALIILKCHRKVRHFRKS